MWKIKAFYTNPAAKETKTVTIIDYYYRPENKLVYFIAIDLEGNFIDAYMTHFKAITGQI